MDEKKKITEETEEEGTEKADEDSDSRDKPEEDKKDDVSERMAELERRQAVLEKSGRSEAGIKTPEKKVMTDEEYADAVMDGKVSPLQEDGVIP